MKRTLATLLGALACCAILAACGDKGKTVKWPALSKLDDATHKLVAAAENAPREELLEAMADWSEAAAVVAVEKPPVGAANPTKVTLLQRDIRSLAKSMTTAEAMPEEFARRMAKGLQPAVHELMEAAGMPHVHGDHDHAEGEAGHEHSEGDGHSH